MVSVAVVAAVAAVVAAAAGAYGAVASAQAAKAQSKAQFNAAKYQAESEANAAEYNRRVALQNATDIETQTILEAKQIERENRLRLGLVRAKIGASGVALEGSAVEILGDVVEQGELERQTVLYKGRLQARGQYNEAGLLTYRRDVYKDRANQAFKYYGQSPLAAGTLAAVGSLSSSAAGGAFSGLASSSNSAPPSTPKTYFA